MPNSVLVIGGGISIPGVIQMPRANATGIKTRQVEFLAKKTDLGLKKTTILKILRFEMPAFSEVVEYAEKFAKAEMAFSSLSHNKLKYSYHYYNGYTSSRQRRIIRYLKLCLAMKGQISVAKDSQVVQDLQEVDIDLSLSESVQSGWIRVGSALQNTVEQFQKYAKEAADLSSYIKSNLISDWWYGGKDEERFGSEQLCFDLRLQFVASCMRSSKHFGMYVQPTEKQQEEIEAENDRREKETFKHMRDMLTDLRDIL